jgi:hypothetical protein
MEGRLKKEYNRRLRIILKSELNAKNKITAIAALAVPVLRYSFGIINWRLEEIKKIDRKTGKLLTVYKMHHPKADTDRLCVKRKGGGRGVTQTEAAHKTEIINIAAHLNKRYKEDQFVNIIISRDSSQPNMNSTVKAAAKITDELSQSNEKNDMKQDGIQNTKRRLAESLKEKWENKVMHGQYIRSIDKQLISEEDTFLWLSKGDLKAEAESEIAAAQDRALQTEHRATEILHTETDSNCRLCHQFEETADRIVSACPILAKEQYIKRHDRVCAELRFNTCKELGVTLDSELWYEHVPKSVETG